jgi:hypothetical protein
VKPKIAKLLTVEIRIDGMYMTFDRQLFRNAKFKVGFVKKNGLSAFFPAQYDVTEALERLVKLPDFNMWVIDTSVAYIKYHKLLNKRRYGTVARMRRTLISSYNNKLLDSVTYNLTERLEHAKVLRYVNKDRRKKTRKFRSGSLHDYESRR